ncbi:protein lethal(2)denticleless isoform X1 [Diorhabda sublineata]|uniref:protein lethal(2)denticleless isoform X1 n=1 Tax=Diorhabda sublineata TaxID=1163346 RepID=UPI0024E041E4|nr:protein lethal(2)denticleless isoform X1 [Diorhabda sublineata]
MQLNDVQSFINQQTGISLWKHCDAPIKRLRCTKDTSYTQLLPQRSQDEFYRDTPIFTCKFSPYTSNEHILALANEDGKLAIHDSSNDYRHGVHAHNNAIFDLAWMFDNMKLVTASGDHTSKMYDVGESELRQERVFSGHSRSVKTVAFRKDDSSVFATGGRDGNIILWDTRTNTSSFVGKADGIISNSHISKVFTPSKSKKKFNTPTNSRIKSVTGLVFQENNTLISCGGGDGLIKIWDLRKHYSQSKKEALPKHIIPYPGNTTRNGYSSLLIDNNNMKLYANCLDNTIYCYNVGTYNSEPIMYYTGHQNSTFYVKSSLSKNGDYLISGSSDDNAYIWNTKISEPIVKLTGHTAEVTCVAWCTKNMVVVTCSDDMSHKIWSVGSTELPDDWEVLGRGIAEIMPVKNKLKRNLKMDIEFIPKKKFTECKKCNNITSSTFCENCNKSFSKRKNPFDTESVNKFLQTDFGPRRLFANVNNPLPVDRTDTLASYLGNNDTMPLDDYEPPLKVPRCTETYERLCKDTNHVLSAEWDVEPPMKLAKLEITPTKNKRPDISSPTVNLPNYVVDGVAPHLTYSPPKKKCQDWLTRIRIEKMIRKEYEKTETGNMSKQPKSETIPKRKCVTPRSPILRYFKVTNSSHSCDNNCLKHQNCVENFSNSLGTN